MKKDQLKKIFFQYRFFWIACCLVLLVNVVFYIFIIRMERRKVVALHHQYIKIRARDTQSFKRVDKSTAPYLKVRKDLKTFVDMLPPVVTVADKVRELNAVLDKHRFSVNRMTFSPDKTSPFSLWKYTTSFTVSGNYSELKNLLADIQNLRGLFCIESLTLNRPRGNDRIDMTLSIATYFK
ncbi:MAG: type 4a pilus biogenesis protein PilO [Desulfobacterales bacterium]|nr:MAG: type 4a pilus biogenesis protein PilO [Desulfobacterales bacterium]